MDKKEFFKSLGFTSYESKTISTLVTLKVATPKEISENSGVPQNKLYQILSKLEKLSLLLKIPSEAKKYKLINLKSFIDENLKKSEEQIKQLKKQSEKLEEINESEEEFIFSLIKGQKAVMGRLAEKGPHVKKEILGVQRNWKTWGRGLSSMKKSIRKGVSVKLIGVIDSETKDKAQEWKKIGCNIRKYHQKFGENPLRFTIFDNKEARITLGKPEISDSKNYITIWTKSKPLINMLRSQFIHMWKESKKF